MALPRIRMIAGPKYWERREVMKRRQYQAEESACWGCIARNVCPRADTCSKWS